jgi:hypothetical protein
LKTKEFSVNWRQVSMEGNGELNEFRSNSVAVEEEDALVVA